MKAVIFDLDNTLYPEYTYIQHWFEQASSMAQERWGVPSGELLKALAELLGTWERLEELDMEGKRNLLAQALARSGMTRREAVDELMQTFSSNRPERLDLYPGAREALEELKEQGFKLALVTDGPKERQASKIEALGIAPLFHCIIYTEEAGAEKPSTAGYELALSRLGLEPSEAVAVGDNPEKDIAPARALGMKTVRIAQGVFKNAQGEGPSQPDILVQEIAKVSAAIV